MVACFLGFVYAQCLFLLESAHLCGAVSSHPHINSLRDTQGMHRRIIREERCSGPGTNRVRKKLYFVSFFSNKEALKNRFSYLTSWGLRR